MKNITLSLVTVVLLAIGLTACGSGGGSGGGSSSTKSKIKELSKHDYIMIFYHYPKDICDSELERNLEFGGEDFIVFSETGDVNCETYGRTEGETCSTADYSFTSNAKSTCIIGVNRTNSASSKLIDDRLILEDMQEAVLRAF